MAYKITETSIYSGNIKTVYSVKIKFDSNVSYFINGGLKITITDNLDHGDILEITSEDIAAGNYTLVSGTELETRIYDSLRVSGGFIAYFSAYDTMNIAMAAKSSNGTDTIGFYASNIKIDLVENDVVKEQVELNADLFPVLIRDEKLRQNNPASNDPVLPVSAGYRQAYDFNKGIDQQVNRYFEYSTTDTMYTNTSSINDVPGKVPLYVSNVSAFTINVGDITTYNFYYDWDYADSYLYNVDSGERTDIQWLPGGTPEAESVNIEIIPGYFANVYKYEITQLLYMFNSGHYRNKLCFNLRSRI